jgi:hypothetical protein
MLSTRYTIKIIGEVLCASAETATRMKKNMTNIIEVVPLVFCWSLSPFSVALITQGRPFLSDPLI